MTLIARFMWGQHGAHLGPTGPRWAPCWPHELCSLGTYGTSMTATGCKSDFKLTTDTPYLAFMAELWGVFYENFEENWLHYKSTALYNGDFIVLWHIYENVHDYITSNTCLLQSKFFPWQTLSFDISIMYENFEVLFLTFPFIGLIQRIQVQGTLN